MTLSITSMTSAATGDYKCEVIAEHPSFRTETRSVFMTVLGEWREREREIMVPGKVPQEEDLFPQVNVTSSHLHSDPFHQQYYFLLTGNNTFSTNNQSFSTNNQNFSTRNLI